jgi:Response regulators consisting of a CheY-like receiver domain and a winged-helix DNA-binding domain
MSNDVKKSILVVEDDESIMEVVKYNLEREGYEVECRSDGREGLAAALERPPDLLVLDLMLPGIDGVEICRQLRQSPRMRTKPILMLTAKSEELDQVVGFTVGADDYVTKPFSVKVLMQRIKVLLSRKGTDSDATPQLERHGMVVDRVAHEASVEGQALPLTPTEFRLLDTLMAQPGKAFSRGDLLESAIGADTIVLDRTIDVHIRSLRAKLGEHSWTIETVRGVGYRFAREAKA